MRSIEILNRGEAVNEYWKAHGLGNDYLVLDCLPSEQNNKLVQHGYRKSVTVTMDLAVMVYLNLD